MRRPQALLGAQAGGTFEHQRLMGAAPGGTHEQVRERRVGFVGARIGQRDLEGREQLELERAFAEVAQLDLAELDVVLRAHPDRGVGLQFGPGRLEADAIGMVRAAVDGVGVGRRVLRDRDGPRLPVPAQVQEAA